MVSRLFPDNAASATTHNPNRDGDLLDLFQACHKEAGLNCPWRPCWNRHRLDSETGETEYPLFCLGSQSWNSYLHLYSEEESEGLPPFLWGVRLLVTSAKPGTPAP